MVGAPGKSRVLVVDDHPIVRERLAELINREPDLLVCGEAEDAIQAMERAAAVSPDIAIVDISLKDTYGIELIKQLKAGYPSLPVLVLSMHDESLYAERALRAGAKGYITKQEATKQILTAIRRVLNGGVYVSEKLADLILQRVSGGPRGTAGSPAERLSDRELEVFQLLGEGMPVKQIAKNLHVSVKTIETHREHIKDKLGFKTSSELLRYAIENAVQEGASPEHT